MHRCTWQEAECARSFHLEGCCISTDFESIYICLYQNIMMFCWERYSDFNFWVYERTIPLRLCLNTVTEWKDASSSKESWQLWHVDLGSKSSFVPRGFGGRVSLDISQSFVFWPQPFIVHADCLGDTPRTVSEFHMHIWKERSWRSCKHLYIYVPLRTSLSLSLSLSAHLPIFIYIVRVDVLEYIRILFCISIVRLQRQAGVDGLVFLHSPFLRLSSTSTMRIWMAVSVPKHDVNYVNHSRKLLVVLEPCFNRWLTLFMTLMSPQATEPLKNIVFNIEQHLMDSIGKTQKTNILAFRILREFTACHDVTNSSCAPWGRMFAGVPVVFLFWNFSSKFVQPVSMGSVFLQMRWDESNVRWWKYPPGCLFFTFIQFIPFHILHQKMHCLFLSARTCWLPSGWRRASVPANRDQAQRQLARGFQREIAQKRERERERETRAASSGHRILFSIWVFEV